MMGSYSKLRKTLEAKHPPESLYRIHRFRPTKTHHTPTNTEKEFIFQQLLLFHPGSSITYDRKRHRQKELYYAVLLNKR